MILHDQLEARVLPRIIGPLGPGNLQYARDVEGRTAADPKARSSSARSCPSCSPPRSHDDYYKDPVERVWAFSEAINQELNALADAGCPVIQMEEPQIHMVPARGKPFGRLEIPELVKIFNNTVKGLRGKTEVWCHTCWGNPAQQRIFRDVQSYQPTLEALNEVDADALTFETCSSGTGDLEAIGRIVTDKKVVIGVIDHHTLQIERPDQVAEIIREALKHIPAERLVDLVRLRDGPRRHEPPPCAVQDGGDGAGHEHRAQGDWGCRRRSAWRPIRGIRSRHSRSRVQPKPIASGAMPSG